MFFGPNSFDNALAKFGDGGLSGTVVVDPGVGEIRVDGSDDDD